MFEFSSGRLTEIAIDLCAPVLIIINRLVDVKNRLRSNNSQRVDIYIYTLSILRVAIMEIEIHS